eukprot:gene6797-biopygen6762
MYSADASALVEEDGFLAAAAGPAGLRGCVERIEASRSRASDSLLVTTAFAFRPKTLGGASNGSAFKNETGSVASVRASGILYVSDSRSNR